MTCRKVRPARCGASGSRQNWGWLAAARCHTLCCSTHAARKRACRHLGRRTARERVGIYDDFFTLGGDSLLAAQVLDLHPRHDALSRGVQSVRCADGCGDGRASRAIDPGRPGAPAVARISRARRGTMCYLPRPPSNVCGHCSTRWPDLPYFNTLYALRLTSPSMQTVLERSFNEIVRRHEILRTTFVESAAGWFKSWRHNWPCRCCR